GLPCGVIAVGQDFSERKQLEEQLRHAQKMEAVGRLAGGVAHDFNNLLQAMASSCEVLRSQAGNADTASRVVDEIMAHVARGAALTRQLLLFARRDVERTEPLDLSEAICQAGTLLRRVIREDIRLEVRCAAEPLPVLADRGQLEQILVNLAVNASDAMPRGGLLTLVTGREQDGFAFFEVADTGEGIPAEISHRVFDPFFTTKGVGKGTGLGLSVVHGIVTRYGGTITLDSGVGTGTRFHIRLPLTAAIVTPAAGLEFEEGVPTGAGERILVVEDEEGPRAGLEELLTLLGYRVTAVASGEAALALGEDERCQLLLSDVMLPGLGGPEVARALSERWLGLRVVLMSGYAEDEALRQRLGTAEMRFLQKPFDLVTVARELAAALAAAPPKPEE
ncbi:MAG: response regulator, partial [Acidobacteria bacterium]|nr:response regulator [Acidobacteriota bacterium]